MIIDNFSVLYGGDLQDFEAVKAFLGWHFGGEIKSWSYSPITDNMQVNEQEVSDEPPTVTKKQFFDWLIANRGYDMDDVINMVAEYITDPIEFKEVKNAIKNALVYKKDDPNVAKIALMLGMSGLIDTIFEEAARL